MLNYISDETLYVLYWDDGLSAKAIAKMLGCSPSAVSMRMKAAGIKTRHASDYPPSDVQREAWKANGKNLANNPKSRAAAAENGKKNKGRRKRTDYDFGGHEKKRSDGYIKVYAPDHPKCTSDGYVMKHILVIERAIGRYLDADECVHHINHIRDDNRLENLALMNKTAHASMHMYERHANRRASKC